MPTPPIGRSLALLRDGLLRWFQLQTEYECPASRDGQDADRLSPDEAKALADRRAAVERLKSEIIEHATPVADYAEAQGIDAGELRAFISRWAAEAQRPLSAFLDRVSELAGRPYTLGRLISELEGSERAFAANSRTADRVEASGSAAGVWWRTAAAALQWQPDPVTMPGIDRIEVLCDELAGGTGLTAANVRQLRARLCRVKRCSLQDADGCPLTEVADALEASSPDQPEPEAPPRRPADPGRVPTDSPADAAQLSGGDMADPGSRIVALRDAAAREYSASKETFWLAAYPAELRVGRCHQHDSTCGTVADGRIALPWGGLHTLGTVGLGEHGTSALLAFSLLHRSTEEVERFLSFAADAGAALVAHPPTWAWSMRRPGGPATTWIAALLFLAPAAAECVVEKPGGCRLIVQPWAASLAALRDWDSRPRGQTGQAPKRSTERGEGRVKLIAALTKHHQYADGGCLNQEPIGNNELAKAAGVSPSTASAFFTGEFEGHTKYKALCRDSGRLAAAIKLLNSEFSPHDLYGRRPAGEDDRDDEGD
jgi:hypothetical protein